MKPQPTDFVSLRCAHRTAGGRQCRLLASDAHSLGNLYEVLAQNRISPRRRALLHQ
jgi:hypothetical protein